MRIIFWLVAFCLMISLGLAFFYLMGVLMNLKNSEAVKKQGKRALVFLVFAILFYILLSTVFGVV